MAWARRSELATWRLESTNRRVESTAVPPAGTLLAPPWEPRDGRLPPLSELRSWAGESHRTRCAARCPRPERSSSPRWAAVAAVHLRARGAEGGAESGAHDDVARGVDA